MTTARDFGTVSERPSDTLFWARTLLWSRLSARGEVAQKETEIGMPHGENGEMRDKLYWIGIFLLVG